MFEGHSIQENPKQLIGKVTLVSSIDGQMKIELDFDFGFVPYNLD
tara:strand:- start:28 stop:162 length:135 start_codon:yes stop_codon:yes gene_type:complete